MTDRPSHVQAWLDDRREEMAALLEALVRVPTENPPGREMGRCANVLCDALDRLGFSPELIALAPTGSLEAPAIVRGTAGNGRELVYYHGHFDVAPAQSASQFEPERRDGKIIGRGTADMKGGLVSMLYGAAAARELGLLDDRKIVFHFVCDEETGSTAGSGHLRAAELIDPQAVAMLTAEPTGGVIWHAARGAITLRVEASGRGARRVRPRGRQRLRAHDPNRRAADPALPRAARQAHELSGRARRGRRLDAGGRRTGRRGRRVQRRARLSLVLGRPALQPRRRP
jgi:succinyl-diaminopimelate desuccinylase